jgi:hypothetical protein
MRAAPALLSLLIAPCLGSGSVAPDAPEWIQLEDVAEAAGLRFQHTNGASGEHLFPETLGSGCAFLDYDRDGWLDVYLVNAGDFRARGAPNALYRNQRDGTFRDVTDEAGVGDTGYGIGVVVGDYNGDGWEDIYICNYGRNTLYRNDGDGTFTDVTDEAGVAEPRWSSSAAFLDLDRDGDLDLYVANYVHYTPTRDGCAFRGIRVYCGPETFDPETDTLYRNNGDGTFTDVSQAAGIAAHARGLGVIAGDYDDDGDPDIVVANDMNPNLLYRNRSDGTFEEVGFLAGIALSEEATMGNGMGVDLADYDNDGALDLIVTNFQDQVNTLYRNDGDGLFTDVSFRSGTGVPSIPLLAWGCGLVDLDNDGWRDLFVVNGHIHDNVEQFSDVGTYAQAKLVFRQERPGVFEDVSGRSGLDVARRWVGRGAAFGDYDNDGDLDVLVNNLNGRPSLYRNMGGNRNGWVRVVLEPPAAAVGARVHLDPANGGPQVAEIHAGGSFASSNDTRALFGLGGAADADVRVVWPDGASSGPVRASAGETVVLRHPRRADAGR